MVVQKETLTIILDGVQVSRLIHDLRENAQANGHSEQLLIGIEQEGGLVRIPLP